MLPGKMALTGGVDPRAGLGLPERASEDSGAEDAPESEAGTSEAVAVPPEPPAGGFPLFIWRLGGLLITLRPHQWVKNVFVLAPMVFAREMFVLDLALRAVGAVGVFCLLAGAVYTMNDLVDLDGDAVHPVKRFRPLPSGRVPLAWGRRAAVGLVVISLGGAALGPWQFFAAALSYFLLNVAYSFRLKKIAYVDVMVIATGFVLRVLAGGFATHTQVSSYLVLCTALLALFLGLGKRRHELAGSGKGGAKQRAALGGYTRRGLKWALRATALVTISAYIAYTFDPETVAFFHSRSLWWTTIFVVLAVWRYLVLVRSRPEAESPTQEMLRDGPFVAVVFSWVVVVMWVVYNLGPG
jgi:decaprenyl-phosphate phosphoribosyltransferase